MATVTRKPIFDAVKALRGGQDFTQAEVATLDAAIDAALGVSVKQRALADSAAFFRKLRTWASALTQAQVDGFTFLLSAMGEARWPIAWAAYGLATPWWETNKTLQPVREAYWLSEEWRKRNLRYYPWYGRGFVQLTWEPNYKRADDELSLHGQLLADPDCALRPDIAARVMVRGMEAGWFTKHSLADHLPLSGHADYAAFKGARRIINGQDKADEIAKLGLAFQDALEAGGWA